MADDLNLGGTNIRTRGGIFFDLVKGYFEPPEVRGVDTDIPGTAGRVSRNRVAVRRTITLDGYVEGSTPSDWRTKTETLFGELDPTSPQTLTVANGYLGTTGSHAVTVRFLNAVQGLPINGPRFQTWSIELECIDPGWT